MKTYDLISSFDNIYLCGTDRCMPDNIKHTFYV